MDLQVLIHYFEESLPLDDAKRSALKEIVRFKEVKNDMPYTRYIFDKKSS